MLCRMGLPVEALPQKAHFMSEAQDKYRAYVVTDQRPDVMAEYTKDVYQPPA